MIQSAHFSPAVGAIETVTDGVGAVTHEILRRILVLRDSEQQAGRESTVWKVCEHAVEPMGTFAGIDLGRAPVPGETTVRALSPPA
jgi:hypothetical protein